LTQFNKLFFSLLVVVGLLVPAAFAHPKEDSHELLSKSFQQTDLWSQGPVKLVAKMNIPKPDGSKITLQLTDSWAAPDKWRSEWTANGLDQVTVLNNSKLSHVSKPPITIVQILQFELAIAMLNGGNPAGPYLLPPVDWEKAKMDTTKKKINGVDAKCLAFDHPTKTFCIDAANGHLLSFESDYTTFEYSDYVTVGNTSYPQTVKVSYAKSPVSDGTLTVTRGDKFADSLFAPPEESTTTDFSSCADVQKNFTAPHLQKLIKAKMPDAARKAQKYGLVYTLADVDKNGTVQKVNVLGGDPALKEAATDAVQQYKYTPYMRCGQAVQFQKLEVVPFAPPAKMPEEPSLPAR
jgi:hypothetical protein